MDGVLLVSERQTDLTIEALGITCDAQEIPTPSDGTQPVGWWLAERSSFRGPAVSTSNDGQPGDLQDVACEGTTALAVTPQRVIGIVSPNDNTTPAVWWSWSLAGLDIQTTGSQGFLKKRPTLIVLEHDGVSIEMSAMSRLWRNSGRYQTGQEGSLVKALQG